MKKLTIILLSMLCLFVAGCTPSPKEEAERLHNDYEVTTKVMWNDEFIPKLQKIFSVKPNTEEQDKEAAVLAEGYKPKLLEIEKKLDGEKVQEKNKHLLELHKQKIKNGIHFLDTLILLKDRSNLNEQNWKTDFMLAGMSMLNTRLEYNNEYSKITTGKGTYELTLANYQKIHKGDSYQKIAETFKMPGRLTRNYDTKLLNQPFVLTNYEWEIDNKHVSISFENGKAYMIAQFNLQ